MTIKMRIHTEDGEEEVQLPGRFVVCPRCAGRGSHDHPAFSHGISPEEFQEDPEFAEQYRAGAFDVTCSECEGQRVVPEVAEECLDAEQRALWDRHQKHLECLADMHAAYAAERRMGA
jgi:hypothetical protein